MQVGTTKDQGLYSKPSAAVHPGALAAGTLPQYNTIQYNTIQYNTFGGEVASFKMSGDVTLWGGHNITEDMNCLV